MPFITTKEYRQVLQTQIDLFEQTAQLAANNKRYSVKCAVIAVQGLQKSVKIINGNFASFRTSTYFNEASSHCEMAAIDQLPYSQDIDNITFYIATVNIANEVQPSRPCNKCMQELKQVEEVVSIVYMDDDMRIVEEVLR